MFYPSPLLSTLFEEYLTLISVALNKSILYRLERGLPRAHRSCLPLGIQTLPPFTSSELEQEIMSPAHGHFSTHMVQKIFFTFFMNVNLKELKLLMYVSEMIHVVKRIKKFELCNPSLLYGYKIKRIPVFSGNFGFFSLESCLIFFFPENIYIFASNPDSPDGNDNYDGSLISPRTSTTFFGVQACAEVRVAIGRNPMVTRKKIINTKCFCSGNNDHIPMYGIFVNY